MKEIIGWYFYPMTYIYPFDRNRRHYVKYFGEYKPTFIKRFVCYILDEKLFPIDWEEIPPYQEEISNDDDPNLRLDRKVNISYYECYTQPDMISQYNIYFRRFIVGLGFIYFNSLLMKKHSFFMRIPLFPFVFYNKTAFRRFVILGWFYYLTCFMLINKEYQKPYN